MNITYRNSDITELVTYSVMITIRIYTFFPLPEDFSSLRNKLRNTYVDWQ